MRNINLRVLMRLLGAGVVAVSIMFTTSGCLFDETTTISFSS